MSSYVYVQYLKGKNMAKGRWSVSEIGSCVHVRITIDSHFKEMNRKMSEH